MTTRRTARLLALLLVLLAAVAVPAASAAAQPGGTAAAAAAAASAGADFDNDGFADLAVGVPGENGGGGAVNVLYGTGAGITGTGAQVFTGVGTGSIVGSFGSAVAAGDFDNDGFADLAAGARFRTVGTAQATGSVGVLYGSSDGLTTRGQLFTQVAGADEQSDQFGSAVAAGDFDNDGFDDLAAGASGENVNARPGAGAVSIIYGSPSGLTDAGGQLFTQVGGAVETGDEFGAALAAGDFDEDGFADLAVGAPGENVAGAPGAGAVSVLYGSGGGLTTGGGQLFTQVGGSAEGGDIFGDALATGDFNQDGAADLAAGAPFEDVGTTELAGAVSVLYGSAGGLSTVGGRLFTQVGGSVERFDLFGFALAGGDLDDDGFEDLIAGAPWERVGTLSLAGVVSVIRGSAGGLTTTGGHVIAQVGGTVEVDDQFGAEVSTGDFDNDGITDLAVGAPAEDVGSIFNAGAVSAGALLFTQDSPGVPGTAEDFDSFGGNFFNAG